MMLFLLKSTKKQVLLAFLIVHIKIYTSEIWCFGYTLKDRKRK